MAYSAKLKRLFPHASKDFLSQNPDLDAQLQNPIQQQIRVQPLEQVLQREAESHVRPYLSITSFAIRLTDEDNLKGGCKALIDCLKKLNLIDDDDPKSLKLEVIQKKVAHISEERTEVKITYADMED